MLSVSVFRGEFYDNSIDFTPSVCSLWGFDYLRGNYQDAADIEEGSKGNNKFARGDYYYYCY